MPLHGTFFYLFDRYPGFARHAGGAQSASVNENMIVLQAVFQGLRHMFIAGFLVVGAFFTDGVNRTSPGAFHALFPLVLQTPGMDVLGSFPVGLKLPVHHETSQPLGAAFFRNQKSRHAERA